MIRSMYVPGDLVLVHNSRVEKELNRKTKPRYLGPFQVNRITQAGTYVLEELDGTISRRGVAAFRLIPYITRNSQEFTQLAEGINSLDNKHPELSRDNHGSEDEPEDSNSPAVTESDTESDT